MAVAVAKVTTFRAHNVDTGQTMRDRERLHKGRNKNRNNCNYVRRCCSGATPNYSLAEIEKKRTGSLKAEEVEL